MKWRQFISEYLRFSKKERIGIMSLLFVVLFIYLLPFTSRRSSNISIKHDQVLKASMDTLNARHAHQYAEQESNSGFQYETSVTHNSKGELFEFDPNTLSIQGWKKLGLREKTVQTIEKYRTRGGKFYKPEDLKKIWGLPQGFYERVKDYITISNSNNPGEQKTEPVAYVKREKKVWNIEINSADTTALIELPGIGSKLALRIINFRDKLGGFYSIDQIAEAYGLADSTFQKIKSYLHVTDKVKKININTASKDELKMHPYVRWNLANAIVEYRNQHGAYNTVEDLKKITLINEEAFKKIAPYLTINL